MTSGKKFVTLFFSSLKLSAFTFGGGYVIIPLMRKTFVEKYHWLEETEMMDLTAVAQSAPGAIAVNAAILVGYRIAGLAGALITVLGTVLPPMVILSIISMFYEAFRSNAAVSMVMQGMAAGVVAVIFDVVLVMANTLWQQHRAIWMVLLGACFVASMLGVGAAPLVLICGLIGMADTLLPKHARQDGRKVRQ